jgi:hypothetical protein
MSAFDFSSRRGQRAATVQFSRDWGSFLAIACSLFLGASAFAQTPAVGAKAPDFTPSTPTGKAVTLSTEQSGDDLVLVFLRDFPGYQCPYCVKQVHDFADHASDFKAKNTRVLLVYPGSPVRTRCPGPSFHELTWGLCRESPVRPFLQEHAGRTCEPLTIVFYSSSQSYWLSSHSAMLKYGNRERVHPGQSKPSTSLRS